VYGPFFVSCIADDSCTFSFSQERMALEDQLKNARARGSGAGRGESDVSVMHDFIRKQAINQQADYSVRDLSVFLSFFLVLLSL